MATKDEQARFAANQNRKWYPGKNIDKVVSSIMTEMTDEKPFLGKVSDKVSGGFRTAKSKFGKFADKHLGTNKMGKYGLDASDAEVAAMSRQESIGKDGLNLPSKFERTNVYGHRLGEIDMGDQDPYQYLMENPGDLRSYVMELGYTGKGGSIDKQNMFRQLFETQEGGVDIFKDYYDDTSMVQQSFIKGAEMQNQIQNALNNPNPGQSGTSVLDLIGDVSFSGKTDVRKGEFERGLKYGEDFKKSLSSDSRFPDPDEGAYYNRDNRIERDDI
jgi:hypothetical protein